jgi:hypothetical protein
MQYQGFDNHSLVSLYKGHLEFYTLDAGATRRRYTSDNHGASWTATIPATGDLWTRPRSNCAITQFDAAGKPVDYAVATVEAGVPTMIVFKGTSTHERAYTLPLARNRDYVQNLGESAYWPQLCYLGSKEFVPPLLPGHPKELEYPA